MFILRTAIKDLKRRIRDPAVFAVWIGMPLTLGAMISLAFGGIDSGEAPTAEVWVVDADESALSGLLVTALASGGDFGFPIVAREVGADEGRRAIDNGDGSALLIIPENFGADLLNGVPTRLELVTNPTQFALPQMVEESLQLVVDAVFYVQQTLGEPVARVVDAADTADGPLDNADVAEIAVLFNDAIRRMDALLFPPVIRLDVVRNGGSDADDDAAVPRQRGFIDIFLPSMLLMSLFFMALGISEDVWVEKEQGTLRRALATPNAAAKFLAGKLLAAAILMASVAYLALFGARILFSAEFDNAWLAGIWTTLTGVLFLTLLFPLQLYATSQRTGNVLCSLVTIPLLMLGGSFFPFDVMPAGFMEIGRLTPNGWALLQLYDVLENTIDWIRIASGAIVIVLVAGLLFIVANRRMAGAFARS